MDSVVRKIVFVTGTRADFGKLKPLIRTVAELDGYEYSIFATGMHMLYRYGMTVEEIHKAGFRNIFSYMNQVHGDPMEMVLANTITGLSRYVHEFNPDLIIVHGDRVEALAGATVGALRNILVGHVEGGEISGTIDDLIRHSITKLAHLHFVANTDAKQRLIQLGERLSSIHVIGSPDIDVMLSDDLPILSKVKEYYEIVFEKYSMVMFHPVTTEVSEVGKHVKALVDAVIDSSENYIVIYPNNDMGADIILNEFKRMEGIERIRLFPSLRFEYFLTLLKNAQAIIGNSSAGIHEAPVFGVPTVNIGTRQLNRFTHKSISNVEPIYETIMAAIKKAVNSDKFSPCKHFGNGNSAELFCQNILENSLWETPKQKLFQNIVDTAERL